MKRLVALIAALAMIGGAWWIRTSIIDDDSGGGDGGGGDSLHLVCGPDLSDVCEDLAAANDSIELTIVDEGTTADALSLSDARADFDAWLTVGPWAQIVADNREATGAEGAGPLGETSSVLGRSPVTFVGPADRIEALTAHCGTVSWVCIGDSSGQQWSNLGGQPGWGAFRAGLAPPESGAGLIALDQAMADRSDSTSWSTADLDDWAGWLNQLTAVAFVDADPLNLLLTRPGSFSVAAPLEQESGPLLQRPANESRYALLYPEPVVTADVTLSAAAGRDVDDLLDRIGADRMAEALAQNGWRVAGQPAVDGVGGGPALPTSANLASPGALQALRERWRG